MKTSDYIVSFLQKNSVKDVFLLAGGGIMHILDSLAQNTGINECYNLHEQASGFCADGYALFTGKTGVCIVTTGPGATNTVTAVASSYIDSTPIVYISGQVKTSDISKIPGVRQTGAQEVDIVSIVKPVTKYAVTITHADEIRYHLEKAFFIANHGRPGPVWLDIPLDVQGGHIDETKLKSFDPTAEGFELPQKPDDATIAKVYQLLEKSKRPVIMVGSGVRLSHAENILLQLVSELRIPVVSSRRMRDFMKNDNDEMYFGCVGVLPHRYANYILQNSDFMLSIGSGLRYYLTAYNEENFAPWAARVIVNISDAELEKLNMNDSLKITSDAKTFIEAMLCYHDKSQPDRSKWFDYCNEMKRKYPAVLEFSPENEEKVNPYQVAHYIGKYMHDTDILVPSPSSFAYVFNVPHIHGRQRVISHIGLGSMGTALPEAIGACVASGKRTIVCEGDGSLQHNIQELSLLRQYNLPIKVFVDVNAGYRQIYTMQNTHFSNRLAGCTPESGISFPDLKLLAKAYGLKYCRIDSVHVMEQQVKEALSDDEPVIIEMVTDFDMEYLPVIKSKMNADGSMQTPSLEVLYPFLSEDEHRYNMRVGGCQDE